MPSAAEMRAELKVLRESHPDHVPVSRMKKVDVMGALERMRHLTETTPAMAQSKKAEGTKMPKKVEKAESVSGSITDVEEAPKAKKTPAKAPAPAPAAKKSEKMPVKEAAEVKPKESMKERMERIRAMKKLR